MEESRVYLRKVATGQLVEASLLDQVIDTHLAIWDASWQTAMQTYCAGRALRDRPEDHYWNWKQKADYWRPLLGYHSFAITCEGDLQGLMLVSDFESARVQSQFGKPIVYVKFLPSAPWNRPEFQTPPCYRGRIGLHSLPKSEPFYRDACKMTELGKDAAQQNLMYYEMTNTQAEEFRLTH